MTDSSRSLHRRRLARTLRRWRANAELSIEAAAAELLCGVGTVHRMENGESAQPLRVKAALELYGAPAHVVAEMVEAAKRGQRRGHVRRAFAGIADALAEYFELEAEADAVHVVEGELIPGLLQTESYARAVIGGADPHVAPEDVDRLLAIRMDRQTRLAGEQPLRLEVVLGEGALHWQVGAPKVQREQLRHLVAVASATPTIEIRVLPFSAGAHPALGRNFTLLSFAGHPEPEMVYVENVAVFVLTDDEAEVKRYGVSYARVRATALSPEDSVSLIARVADGIQ
ncbi:DUF5753 domain-containing protein [Streptoalloteichus hindustanus]|nr:DUF5753 domain-containing protein [Streptoalloteichus hindustanus]